MGWCLQVSPLHPPQVYGVSEEIRKLWHLSALLDSQKLNNFSCKKEERDLSSLKSKSNLLSVVLLTAIPELGGGAVAN